MTLEGHAVQLNVCDSECDIIHQETQPAIGLLELNFQLRHLLCLNLHHIFLQHK